jgi:GTP-binding protein HflX
MLLRSRQRSSRELAVLVAVEFTSDRFHPSPVAQQARAAAAVVSQSGERGAVNVDSAERNGPGASAIPKAVVTPPTDLDFDASLAEFQELARSAGATIAAVLIQRRGRPDPATLVGGGKLDEIVATVASTGASLVLFDHRRPAMWRRGCPARSSTERNSFWTSLPATRAPAKACCRWNWPSWSINCHG